MNVETAFDLLSHPHRRTIVTILDESAPIARQQLIDRLLDREAKTGDATRTRRRRVRIALHHNHLPRLADTGVIEYDEETIHTTSRLQTLVTFLPHQYEPSDLPCDFLNRQLKQFYA